MDQLFVNLKNAIVNLSATFLPDWATVIVSVAVSIGAIAVLGPVTMMYLTLIERHVAVLNHALRNVAADKVRMHVCWGNYEGPHHCDVEMAVILPTLMKAKPAALLFETSNPRHQHDHECFTEQFAIIPDDKILIPGVIDSTTNFIEHPKVVANRILQFTNIVGRERVIAGTDCGFSTFAGFGVVDPEIVWAKLASLAQGAEIASAKLWSRAA